MRELINSYIAEFCTEVHDMPFHELELKMDNHKCIEWESKEYFIPDDSYTINEDDELIYKFLVECFHV